MNDSIIGPLPPSLKFSAWIARYHAKIALLLLATSIFLFEWDPDFVGLSFLFVWLGEALRVWAAGYLYKEELSTGGPYSFVRNPMYLGSVLVAVGFCVFAGSIWIWLLALLYLTVISLPAIKYEERILAKKFPMRFEAYAAQVPPFFPTLRAYRTFGVDFSRKQVLRNREHFGILVIILLSAYLSIVYGNIDLLSVVPQDLSLDLIDELAN